MLSKRLLRGSWPVGVAWPRSSLCVSTHSSPARGHPTSSRAYATTPPLQRKWFKGLLRFGKKSSSGGEPGTQLSLFHQEHLPEDLRLPVPADPVRRSFAGLIDAAIAVAGGSVAATAAHLYTGDPAVAAAALKGGALLLWSLRDSLGDDRTRSLGKRFCGLEIANWDGTLAAPGHAALRQAYFLLYPLTALHPIAEMVWTVMMVFDVSSVFLTPDARKLGDYVLGTRVVNERPGRAVRIQDRADTEEIAALRDRIAQLAGVPAPSLPAAAQQGAPAMSANRAASDRVATLLPGVQLPQSLDDAQAELQHWGGSAADVEKGAATPRSPHDGGGDPAATLRRLRESVSSLPDIERELLKKPERP